ncbi:APC family permease [Taibaiella soli]|uniref:Amino acid permease n=1 Tax=Taibaiella soli TaxID=1649169 RepID=A0A2W2BII9_9BACT|nr:amino acid permease [Taibaiella soli]PZF73316.1 amino acid permease [Taibaiella soli]
MQNEHQLQRGLSLPQATAINMIDMVGIGPFIIISGMVSLMAGPASLIAWVIGAFLAYMDGMVWAEMGAKWPEAGGSYVFLQKLFGGNAGRLMAFLFVWQTSIQAPLVVASGAIGFSQYFSYLIPLDPIQKKMVSGALVIVLVALLYRDIKSIGKISIVLSAITIGTMLWIIFSGAPKFNTSQVFDRSYWSFDCSKLFFAALGQASLKAVYSYLGYYNVCHLGGEIKNPSKNIPRAIFLSITGIAILYLGMQTVILGVVPWQQLAHSDFVISLFFETVYNHTVAQVATFLILCIALASLFAVILGYSRVPYAAALKGDFFPVFGKVHPRLKFPHVSLLALGGLAFIFSLLFRLGEVISAIVTMRILIQFVSQAVGVIRWHYTKPGDERPFKMPLFPIPAIISIIIWLYILTMSETIFIALALGIIVLGIIMFYVKESLVTSKSIQR